MDIAQLQIRIETTGAKEGGTQLHKLSVEGKQTEATMRSLERINKTLEASYRQQTNQIRATAKQTEVLRDKTFTLSKANDTATRSTDTHTRSLNRFIPAGVAAAVSIGGMTYAAKQYIDANVDVEKSMVRIRNTLNFVTGDAKKSADEWEFLKQTARTYGQDLQTLALQYGKFSAAAKGSRLQGEPLHQLFEGMSAAALTLGLEAEQTEGAFRALEQIMSKGRVSMEELRQQLGDRMPGAFKMAADAMGVTTAELEKLIAKGVDSTKFLLAFEKGLNKTFNTDIANKTDTLTAAISNFRTEYFLMLGDNNSELVQSLADTFRDLADTMQDPGFQQGVVALNDAFSGMIDTAVAGTKEFAKLHGVLQDFSFWWADIFEMSAKEYDEEWFRKEAEKRVRATENVFRSRLGWWTGDDFESGMSLEDRIAQVEKEIRAEFAAARKAYDEELKAAREKGTIDGGTVSLGYAGPDMAAFEKAEAEKAKLRKKALSMFDDPAAQLMRLEDQYREEREFLKNHQEEIFRSEYEFNERLYQLQVQYEDKKKDLQKEVAESRIKGFTGQLGEMKDYFNELSILAQGESFELFAINKAFALADATVKGIQAVQGAWASAPFPANIPAVAMTTAKTAVNVAAINSQTFAGGYEQGGIVGGNSYSGDNLTANVNSGEMILNRSQQANLFKQANGGGSSGNQTVIHIENHDTVTQVRESTDDQGRQIITIINRVKAELTNEFARGDGPTARAIEGPLLRRAGALK